MAGIRPSKYAWLPLCLSILGAALWLPQVRLVIIQPQTYSSNVIVQYTRGKAIALTLTC